MHDQTIAIIGLGLIGGSLARDLAERGARVLGYDADPETLRAALQSHAVHSPMSPSLAEVSAADVVVLAVPVAATAHVLTTARPHLRADTLITDVCSTKRSIEANVTAAGLAAQFVGAHPLAGYHRAGWTASRTGLFRGASVYLCRPPMTPADVIDAARRFWEATGGLPVVTSAAAHDELLAHTSHLPQVVAFLLARTLAQAGIDRSCLGPGGRDSLRLAASPPQLWTGIAIDNAGPLTAALSRLRANIADLELAVLQRDSAGIRAAFEEGGDWFRAE